MGCDRGTLLLDVTANGFRTCVVAAGAGGAVVGGGLACCGDGVASARELGLGAASELEEAPEHSADPLSVASTSTKSSSPAHVVSDDSAEDVGCDFFCDRSVGNGCGVGLIRRGATLVRVGALLPLPAFGPPDPPAAITLGFKLGLLREVFRGRCRNG